MSRLRIAEIFRSVQGEGILVGTPSTFIRISGCNLRCIWCDTPYASWNPEGPVVEVAEILDQAADQHVVVTGGEPMLFEAAVELCEGLKQRGKHITIETAGTVYRELPCDLMSISPKLAHSKPTGTDWEDRHEAIRQDRAPLARLMEDYDCQLKIVVNPDDPDWRPEVEELLSSLPCIVPSRILMMAEGTDAETLHNRERQLVDVCLEMGWRLSPRLHIDLFGNTKGT